MRTESRIYFIDKNREEDWRLYGQLLPSGVLLTFLREFELVWVDDPTGEPQGWDEAGGEVRRVALDPDDLVIWSRGEMCWWHAEEFLCTPVSEALTGHAVDVLVLVRAAGGSVEYISANQAEMPDWAPSPDPTRPWPGPWPSQKTGANRRVREMLANAQARVVA